MNGKRTAIILGAGTSFCYKDGEMNFPTQYNILEKLVYGVTSRTGGAPDISDDTGMKHSHGLSQYLRKKYNLPEDISKGHTPTDFWPILQKKGQNLESLYSVIEKDVSLSEKEGHSARWLLDDFEAIVRSSVTRPNYPRERKKVCRYHRMLCEALEPGDYVINFNWDSLMADALLYYSHFWFPSTGFGLNNMYPLMWPCQKKCNVNSIIKLYHIHGSVCLFEWDHQSAKFAEPTTLYVGPKGYSSMTGLHELLKVEKNEDGTAKITGNVADDQIRRSTLGHIYFDDNWFKPIFVPPSKYKKEYSHWYSLLMRRSIHASLPFTKQLIIAGYSFPPADIDHLSNIFVKQIIPSKAKLSVIDPSNENEDFRERVKKVFPNIKNIDFSFQDFRKFCMSLSTSETLKKLI